MTNFAQQTISQINRDVANRAADLAAKYPGFTDTITEHTNRHGRGKTGFTCGGYAKRGIYKSIPQTMVSGESLPGFAKRVFGKGKLQLIERTEHGSTYVVIQ